MNTNIKQFAIPLAIIALVLLTIYKVFGNEDPVPTREDMKRNSIEQYREENARMETHNKMTEALCLDEASRIEGAIESARYNLTCLEKNTKTLIDIDKEIAKEYGTGTTTGTASGTPVSSAPEQIVKKDTGLDILQKEICKASKESPLCTDIAMLTRFKGIADKQGVPLRFAIGVTYAESHIGVNFKPTNCSTHNNWAGLKGYKYDPTKWSKATKLPDKEGCWLYKFESPEQGFTSLVNTLKDYQINKCSTPECVSKNFVGTNKETKRDWSWRVRLFFNP